MTRLSALTPDQRAAMDTHADLWIERGMSTEPADRARVEDGLRRCYEYAGIPWHGNVVWVGSPLVAAGRGHADTSASACRRYQSAASSALTRNLDRPPVPVFFAASAPDLMQRRRYATDSPLAEARASSV